MKTKIIVKGACEHNLKNLDLEIPRDQLVVFTGVSGSGKSSLAFDTLYAEGQRRYVESLSSYARQFLGQMEKPKLDYIEGLSPAISIEQKAASKNPRSTVGTVTEIYDYLRVLYARAGVQHCHICGDEVGSQSIDQIIGHIMDCPEGTKMQILAPVVANRKGTHETELEEARAEGFVRVMINGKMRELSEDITLDKKSKHNIDIVVDRLAVKDSIRGRLTDSVETALKLAGGMVKVHWVDADEYELLSENNSCSRCGVGFPELSPQHFSFNSPLGMCPACNGLGTSMEFDPDKLIADHNLSLNEGAVIPFKALKGQKSWRKKIIKRLAEEYEFSLDTPWKDLPQKVRDLLMYGVKAKRIKLDWKSGSSSGSFMHKYEGVVPEMKRRMSQTQSEYMKRYYMGFLSEKPCPECDGKKLRPETLAVYLGGKAIDAVTGMTIEDAHAFFTKMELSGNQAVIAHEVVKEITNRLSFLMNVGLHYLTLDRKAPTLSGGESQRIRLASQIGSSLVGVMYILDEPSIGLHQRDNSRLIDMLLHLRDLGNTVLVVEHDEEMMRTADHILDFGPKAGVYGGQVVASGNLQQIKDNKDSLTGAYLAGRKQILVPEQRREPGDEWLRIKSACHNNLKKVDVDIPLGVFTCITGVSGSGKSSLINQTLLPWLHNRIYRTNHPVGAHDAIEGAENVDKVIAIDQQPIGRTPRSNPSTYIKVFDDIRTLFAELPQAKIKGYKPGRFSFNVKGGRCETCQGGGMRLVEMHFLPDIWVTCETCNGQRYNRETLSVRFKGYNIAEVLDLDVQQALEVFENIPKIRRKLQTLMDVGMDYVKLGQASTTLSGGEAQRIKLARELAKTSTGNTVYVLDEPTTGLHFEDINKLLKVLQKLTDMGNTIIVIEHNLDVIKSADYIIDIGPEGGSAGGKVVASGTPEKVIKNKKSYTGKFLKQVL